MSMRKEQILSKACWSRSHALLMLVATLVVAYFIILNRRTFMTMAPHGGTQATARLLQHSPEHEARRQHTQTECSRKQPAGQLEGVLEHGSTSYCPIPKAGCTFWKSVFRFLHPDIGQFYKSPFEVPRKSVHIWARQNMKIYNISDSSVQGHLATDLRFMFVRDPYSRLWSAYLDKLFLLDFWSGPGIDIIMERHKGTDNQNKKTVQCAVDISFKEFLEYVVSQDDGTSMNRHWRPMCHICSPCLYQPHIIGKIETFSQDMRYLLHLMNIPWVFDSYNHNQHMLQEMDLLIDYNFDKFNYRHWYYIQCITPNELSRRLWKTFQFNGYLPMEAEFPDPHPTSIDVAQFRTLVHKAFIDRPNRSKAEWQQQRQQAMKNAYHSITMGTVRRIQQLYRQDFILFDYDPEPDSLFGNRHTAITEM